MTFLDFVPGILGSLIGFLGFEFTTRGFQRFRKPLIIRWEWKDIKKLPIPDIAKHEILLVTDCREVDAISMSSINYDSTGKRVWDYNKKVITHWSYLPSVPLKEKE